MGRWRRIGERTEMDDDSDLWELWQGEILIGKLDVTDQDMFWFTARFEPTAVFEPYRALFAEGQDLRLSDDPAWGEWLRKTNNLGMHLTRVYNQARASEFILYINDDEASFRPSFDQFRKVSSA